MFALTGGIALEIGRNGPTSSSTGGARSVATRADPRIHSVTHERCRGAEFCSAAFFDQGHGMDSRVSATPLRGCSALE